MSYQGVINARKKAEEIVNLLDDENCWETNLIDAKDKICEKYKLNEIKLIFYSSLNMDSFDNIVNVIGNDRKEIALKYDADGFAFIEDNEAYIGVKTVGYTTRTRFTVAHELGHIVLHHVSEREKKPRSISLSADIDWDFFKRHDLVEKEQEANAFAAELLMPEKKILKYLESLSSITSKEEKTIDLAYEFNVSKVAMKARLRSLKL